MKVELIKAESPEIIMNLFQYYIYDMSEYTGFSPNPNGTYTVDESVVHLNDYWTKADHYPFYIKVDDQIAGFSLIRKYPNSKEYYDMGQFFILRKYKGRGVGRKAFECAIGNFPGKWITRVLPHNRGAYKFWNKVIREFSESTPVLKNEYYGDKEMIFFYYDSEGKSDREDYHE